MLTCHSRTVRLRGSGLLAPRRRMATIACSMPASVYSRVARKREFSTLSLRSAVENGSFSRDRVKYKASLGSRRVYHNMTKNFDLSSILLPFMRLSYLHCSLKKKKKNYRSSLVWGSKGILSIFSSIRIEQSYT